MKFDQTYNRNNFLQFLGNFLPEDFDEKEEDIVIVKERYKKIKEAKILGFCDSFGLHILEMEHESENDPRVTVATDAFKILADHWIHKALIVFKSKKSKNYRLSLLTISLDLNEKNKAIKKYSNARRYSFYLGPGAKIKTPEQQLIKKGGVKDIEDLFSRFSLEVVNKQFYLEVAKYFDELVSDEAQNFALPSQIGVNVRKSFAVRLIGRIMFCWFLKQKKSDNGQLVPDELLSSKVVIDNYYHNVLERLFFEVLNTNIDERDIRNEFYDKVPYLNGGLFSPQSEDYYELDRNVGVSKYINTLKINDDWFKNFFELLETYNFTIDENTVFDQELSVDPEMLGRIFENLLAKKINLETGNTEKKDTGSFYTPRQIVEYIVDQSLIEYFKTKTGIDKKKLAALVSYDEEDDFEHPLNDNDKQKIIDAVESLKILDPACGSGAFPIGALQKIVYILQIVDPNGVLWRDKKLKSVPELYRKKIEEEFDSQTLDYIRKLEVIKSSIFGVDIQPIAIEVSRLRCFLTLVVESEIDDTKKNRGIESLPNLDFKFVCANTLIPAPEQEAGDENRLFSDDFQKNLAAAVDKYFSSAGANKISASNEIHKLIDGKIEEKLKHLDNLVSYGGNRKIEAARAKANKKQIDQHARILTLWGSYKNIFENKPVDFFETKYFFPSVKNGFDIVIGNPPYVSLEKEKENKEEYRKYYKVFASRGDLYCLFYEQGIKFLRKDRGLLCYITSNKWMRAGYGEKLREFFAKKNPLKLLDFGGLKVFESATVDTSILFIQNNDNKNKLKACHFKNDYKKNQSIEEYFEKNKVLLSELSSNTWFIGNRAELNLKKKIEEIGTPLKDWDVNIYRGIVTGLNEAFIINQKQRDELVVQDPKSAEIIKPVLRGRDIKRYSHKWAGFWVIITKFGSHKTLQKDHLAVYEYLKQYEEKLKARGQCKYSRVGKNSTNTDYKGQHHWLELDNNPKDGYLEEFEKKKVVWSDISTEPTFHIVEPGIYFNNTAYMISGGVSKYFTGILNSSTIRFYFPLIATGLGEKGNRYFKQFVELLPIPKIKPKNKKTVQEIEFLAGEILKTKKQNPSANTFNFEKQIDKLVYKLYDLTEEEIKIIEDNK